jgi:hypothetical protein
MASITASQSDGNFPETLKWLPLKKAPIRMVSGFTWGSSIAGQLRPLTSWSAVSAANERRRRRMEAGPRTLHPSFHI